MRKINLTPKRAAGVIIGSFVGTAGMAVILAAGGGTAFASSPPGTSGQVYGNPVELSVTVPESTTLTLQANGNDVNNNVPQPVIKFGTPSFLPAVIGPANSVSNSLTSTWAHVDADAADSQGSGGGSTAVQGTVVSNDPGGYTVYSQGSADAFGQITTTQASGSYIGGSSWKGQPSTQDTGESALPAVACTGGPSVPLQGGGSYSDAATLRIADTWAPGFVVSGGGFAGAGGQVAMSSSGYALSVAGDNQIAGGVGMVNTSTVSCTQTEKQASGTFTIGSVSGGSGAGTYTLGDGDEVLIDTFTANMADSLPWSDLSVLGTGAGTAIQFTNGAAGSGATPYVQTYKTTTASAAGGDPIDDVYTLTVPGSQAPGTYVGNLGYAVFSN